MSVLSKIWLPVRGAIETVVARERLDSLLGALGFFALKDKLNREEVRLPDGLVVTVRPDDRKIIHEVYEQRCYAKGEVVDGDVVVDVGAHIGLFTLGAARRTPKGRVVAVEPSKTNRALLEKNLQANGIKNVRVRPVAVGERPGREKLFYMGDNALTTLRPLEPRGAAEEVEVTTLDKIFEEESIANCALLKLDVERSEINVLKGGAGALKKTRQVLVESGKEEGLHEECLRLLRAAGFQCVLERDDPGAVLIFGRR